MRIATIGATAALVLALSGCSVLSKLSSPAAQPFDAVGIAVGVDAIAGTNLVTRAARAAAIKTIAQEILTADTGTTVTIDGLFAVAQAKVDALSLPPGDAAAGALFLSVVRAAADAYVSNATATNPNVQIAQTAIAFVCNAVIAEATRLGG